MKKKLIPIILVVLSLILFIVAIILVLNTDHFKFSNKTENKDNNQTQIKEENPTNKDEANANKENNEDKIQEENNNQESKDNETPIEDNKELNNNVKEENNQETKPENNTQNNTNQNETKDEVNIITYFETQNNSITEGINQDDRTLRKKVKDAFVTVVDFIFYDKEVKGYTFDELTTNAKLKVISIALSIDNKIDEYFPDYKDVIKDKYDNIKGKLAVKYLEFTSSLCETVGADTCNQAKEDFNNMKESFSITWQLIKELATNGSTKVKEFYESWRDSE